MLQEPDNMQKHKLTILACAFLFITLWVVFAIRYMTK